MTRAVRPCPLGLVRPGDSLGNAGLVGRRDECAVLDQLVEAVWAGESRALVVCGDPGVGKTALLDHLVGRPSGCRVVRASGVQSEMELAFAGMHQLCAPLLNRLERLPGPQRDALGTAFGLSAGPAPDRFLVGLAVLGLLTEAAREQPLVCVIDDAQRLDRASMQTLAFVARRLGPESVAVVVATRTPDEPRELSDVPHLRVEGLPQAEARALLCSAVTGPVDERVLDRILAEARGNPLALVELSRGLTAAELAVGFGLPHACERPGPIEENCLRQLAALPADTRLLLLIAAAEPTGDPVLVWRAADKLGMGFEAETPAAEAGLLEIDARVRFRHPLLRSAVYRAASAEERRTAHRALAQATDPEADPDRRVWHAAQAAAGLDEDVAAELERSAWRARARGGLAAAAAFLRRAPELSPDPARRVERALDAARASHQAGLPNAALRQLAIAEAGPLDKPQRACVDLQRGQIAFTTGRAGEAAPLLLTAATQLESLDVRLARETHLEALWAAWLAGPRASGDIARGDMVREAARAARAAPPAPQPPGPADLLLDGLATQLTDGYAAGTPILKQALCAFCGPDLPREEGLRWLQIASFTAALVWDDEAWEKLTARLVQLAREAGALAVLPRALSARIGAHASQGELAAAAALAEKQAEATGVHLAPYGALSLAAWRGREADAAELLEATRRKVPAGGEGLKPTAVHWASALLCNSLSRYEDALVSAGQASEPPHGPLFPTWALAELVEAASRTAHAELATDALQRLTATTRFSGSDWALGIQSRARALCGDGPAAESAYREAIGRLGRTRMRGELARAHLLYGEWLRRENRRLDAREQLRTAHEMFTAMGAEGFAGRAARELQSTGEAPRKRGAEAGGELTGQEAQIVRLVREGLTNPDIAARLFISPRTVEWHLNKIFTKLNITSRKQLRRPSRARPEPLTGGL